MNTFHQFEAVVKQAFSPSNNNPQSDLSQRIILAIEREKRVRSIWFLVLSSMATVAISVVGVLVWRVEGQSIVSSQFGQILALLFSDFGVVTTFWKEYTTSLVESIPFVSLVMVGMVIWAGLMSLYQVVKNSFNLIHHSLFLRHN